MDSRSNLSQEKDEFNFALILASDLKHYLDSNRHLQQVQRICIFGIYLKLTSSGKATSGDLQQLKYLLGHNLAQSMFNLAKNKAMLETDFVNSQ